ncbi:MAG TPA: hypothetical protein VE573_00830 [Nitrososphaeraceae archaeon]|jgi:hypothetical protein|nr:hypothetical protein [Nitrososphaeraceae archaeon]
MKQEEEEPTTSLCYFKHEIDCGGGSSGGDSRGFLSVLITRPSSLLIRIADSL